MKNPGIPWPDNEKYLNPRAAWRFPCKLVLPHNVIDYKGERWVEVEWPRDGKYDIGFQLALENNGAMRLFESAKRLKDRAP
jgi:hypothetical protein